MYQEQYIGIAICGLISSGKTTLTNLLATKYEWDRISFGAYIRHYAEISDYPMNRDTYQGLGQKLFERLGASDFLNIVIKHNAPRTKVHLFDGIRHVQIIYAMKQIYAQTFVIYVNVDDKIRYERYSQRNARGDKQVSYKDFIELSNKQVESEISDISSIADLVINGNFSTDIILQIIESRLKGLIIST